MMWLSYLLSEWTLLLAVIVFLFYKYSTATHNFFKEKNVPFVKPLPLFGNFLPMFFQPVFNVFQKQYNHFSDKKFYGVFAFRVPSLVIKDPDLIRNITVKDFDHFVNHYCMVEEQDAPLFTNSIFFLKDQKWKDMRTTLSPAFTGSKMRLMFQLIEETCRSSIEYLKSEEKKGPLEIELKEYFTRYTSDVIATTAFGLKIDSLTDKNNEFYTTGRSVSNFGMWVILKMFLPGVFRKIMRLFQIQVFDKRRTDYLHNLVIDSMKYRTENNIFRPDMINLLMEARQGKLKSSADDHEDVNGLTTFAEKLYSLKSHNREWSDVEIVAQCFLFFIAGFEPTSILMSFCGHELMENPDIQEKLIIEIDDVKNKLNGKPLTYEILQKMKYLEMVTSETLRKWPPLIQLDRICSKDYTIVDDVTGTSVEIKKNDVINIPVSSIHRDPKYYPNPEKFDPERFNDENKGNIIPFTFIPFGNGPRFCIGTRLALMESKAIIFHLLSEFTFEPSKKSCIPIELAPGFSNRIKNGFWIKLQPRNKL